MKDNCLVLSYLTATFAVYKSFYIDVYKHGVKLHYLHTLVGVEMDLPTDKIDKV